MNSYRLPSTIIPVRYDLRLEPDLQQTSFEGSEIVELTVREAADEIVLNAAELEILHASISRDGGAPLPGTVELDRPLERCRIRFPQRISPGSWRLSLSFRGILNDKLRGFYRSQYKDEQGGLHLIAATQFEATDARRAFPCWDEPAFKAVFAVTLVVDADLKAVSNTSRLTDEALGDKRVIRFKDTIPMSTYLLAFVVGRVEGTEPVMVGQTPLRVWAVPGKLHLAAFGQAIGAFSLRFFEDYYGIAYPGDKLDLLAIPDFAAGAMENLGAITFRENALLVDQQAASLAELERVADVVAHENAHMWFGDLVTMSWWNGLWLNEAFATFMEMLAVDAWKPEWHRWDAFGASRGTALAVDGLHATRSIEYQVSAPKDADAMFDSLTYEKGASVLRMLEQHLGPEVFRNGIRLYLKRHAYANADTRDLWTALEAAAKQPVPALMDAWVFTPGYPLVTGSLDESGSLVLMQRRFTYLPADVAEFTAEEVRQEQAQRWQVPIQLKIRANGTDTTQGVLLTDATLRIPLPRGFESVVVNAGGPGFYRVHYDRNLLDRIMAAPERLDNVERFNLVNDAWAGAMAGLLPLSQYLDLIARFRDVCEKTLWGVVIESLQVLNRLIEAEDRPLLEGLVRTHVGPMAARLGWAPQENEPELIRQLRGDLLRALGTLGNDRSVQNRAAELHAGEGEGRDHKADPNVLAAAVAVLAHCGDAGRFDEFDRRFRQAATPQEERRYLYALTAFQHPALHDRTLRCTLDGAIRTQDGPFVVSGLLTSVYARERAWEFVKANWDAMDRRFPRNGLRRMCGGLIGLATPALEQDVRRFVAEHKVDLGGKTLAQYLEQLRIVVTLRERELPALKRYLRRA